MNASALIRRIVQTSLVLLMGAWGGCSGGSDSGDAGAGVAARLRFVAQPSDGLAGRPFLGPIRVAASSQPNSSDAIEIRLEGAPASWLHGTLVRPLVRGVATFDDLSVERAGGNLVLVAALRTQGPTTGQARSSSFRRGVRSKRHIILMIADGLGYPQIEATASFTGKPGSYAGLSSVAMATWDENVRQANGDPPYDPKRAWSEFSYLIGAATDSGSSATAMYTGVKTNTGRLSVAAGTPGARLQTIADLAQWNGVVVGAVTTVPINHATPAAWVAHNKSRDNLRAIGDEMLFGDPGATGLPTGSRGASPLLPHVLIGGGHPVVSAGVYISVVQWERARQTGWTVVDRYHPDRKPYGSAPARLLQAAATADRLFGLFGSVNGNIPMRKHDGSGLDPAEPTLAQMSRAALVNLARHPNGFCLVIEGGAIDWSGHVGDMSRMIGEMIDFDEAVADVLRWIEDPNNGSDWDNTLLIVTGDHETGLLTAGPGVFPNQPLGNVTDARIRAETTDGNSGMKASWDDANQNGRIDFGGPKPETVYWAWNTIGHSNTLIPCHFKGLGSDRFAREIEGVDPVRGNYIDNTALYRIMLDALGR